MRWPASTWPRRPRPWPSFTGAGRRFELRGERDGIRIVDDYAHHPTELAATIAAARTWAPGRVVVCFQPHMPWRTEALASSSGARWRRPTRWW